jgi:hypothetical protein
LCRQEEAAVVHVDRRADDRVPSLVHCSPVHYGTERAHYDDRFAVQSRRLDDAGSDDVKAVVQQPYLREAL